MKIRLLKKHKTHKLGKELPVGTEFTVSNYRGDELIKKGIAENVDVNIKPKKVVNLQKKKTINNDSKESKKIT